MAESGKSEVKNDQLLELEEIIEVPDGGYGWFVVIGLLSFSSAIGGTASGYSVYLSHYLNNNIFNGANKIDFALIGGLELGAGYVITPVISLVNQKYGAKTTTSIGSLLLFLGLFLSGFVTKLWQLYLTQGLMIGIGYGSLFIPSYGVTPQWFRKKRSFATAIGSCGSGIGGVLFNLSTQAILERLNLKWALIIQSIECAVLCIIGVILIRTRNDEVKINTQILDFSHFKYPIFSVYLISIFLMMQGYVVLLFNLADYTKTLGYSSSQAAIVSCMVSVGFIIGRPAMGRLCDIFGPVTVNIFNNLFVMVICVAWWIPTRNYASAIAFGVVAGFTSGTIWVNVTAITTRIFGLRNLGTSLNMVWIITGIAVVVSPVIAIQLRGAGGNGITHSPTQYVHPALYCGFSYLGAAIMSVIIRAYLLARDELAEKKLSHEDNNELFLYVSLKDLVKKLNQRSPHRKI